MIQGQIFLAGQRYTVSRDAHGRRFVGDETAEAFVERMNLLGRHDVLRDLAAIGRGVVSKTLLCDSPKMTAWALHQNRVRTN